MNVRRFHPNEVEAIASLFTESVHANAAEHYDARQRAVWAPRPPNVDEWRRRLAKLHTLVAEEDGRLLGFLSYEGNGHIDLLYVAPGCARRGVASRLYADAEALLASAGVTSLFTEASAAARPFFERMGYAVVEEQRVERSGVELHRYAMKKRVSPHPNPLPQEREC